MEIKVKLNNLRTSPRKVRQVIDLVRGKKVQEAQSILLFTVNKSARSVLKLLNSAVATATHDLHLDESKLVISSIRKSAEVDFLHSRPDFKLLFVDVPVKIRYVRMKKRAREDENILSFEDFKILQEKEMNGTNSQNLSYCQGLADYQIDNSGSLPDLFTKIDDILG